MNIRGEALNQLEQFVKNNLSLYATERNFDYGPQKRTNTSNLSKYITHRVIDEEEVIQSAYKKFSFKKIEKFIQEVLWRTYWKGWLEMRPQVWRDYTKDVLALAGGKQKQPYQDAINGKTSISCFNDWTKELQEYGYLHNHTRMWFASIWVFTLNLPWQLGADFFLRYLKDGDAASNTLSWRWVAGLHTKGKHYLASEWNINKFSSKKYNNLKLNENAKCCIENKNYEIISLQFENINYENSLMLFHNLDFSFALKYQTILQCNHYGMINFNSILQEHNYAKDVLELKSKINQNLQTLIKEKYNSEIIIHNKEELNKIIKEKNISTIILPYLTTGYENDFISTMKNEINIKYLTRDYDKFCWPFATKGYFAFKEQIPKIIAKFV